LESSTHCWTRKVSFSRCLTNAMKSEMSSELSPNASLDTAFRSSHELEPKAGVLCDVKLCEAGKDLLRMIRDSACENSQVISQMKLRMQELQSSDLFVQERFETLEQKLHQEQTSREVEMHEIRELVGGEKLALQEYVGQVRELLAQENSAREMHLENINDFLARKASTCEMHIQDMRGHISQEVAVRHEHCSSIVLSLEEKLQQLSSSIEGRFDRLEGFANNLAQERAASAQGPLPRELSDGSADRIDRLERELRGELGTLVSGVDDLCSALTEEKAARERHEASTKESEESMNSLNVKVLQQHDGQQETFLAFKQAVALQLQQQQDQVDEQLAALKDLLRRESELVRNMSACERAAREAGDLALRDCLQQEREARDTRIQLQAEDLARERNAREHEDRAVQDLLKELLANDRTACREFLSQEQDARRRSCDTYDQRLTKERSERESAHMIVRERLDSLERSMGSLDGLFRAAHQVELAESSQRLWETLDKVTSAGHLEAAFTPRQLQFTASPRQASSLHVPVTTEGAFRRAHSPPVFPAPVPVAPLSVTLQGASGIAPVSPPVPWFFGPRPESTRSLSPGIKRAPTTVRTPQCCHTREPIACGPPQVANVRSPSTDHFLAPAVGATCNSFSKLAGM